MARVYIASTPAFDGVGRNVVVVDCGDDDDFDEGRARLEATKLRGQTGADAVVVQRGAKFWVF